MPPRRPMTVIQAARAAECNPETIRRAIRSKELLATKDPVGVGRGYRITVADLNAFLEKRRSA
jgi:excisionase family DNA binding protein